MKAYMHNSCKLELVTGDKEFKYKSSSGRYKYKSECKSYTHVRCCMLKKSLSNSVNKQKLFFFLSQSGFYQIQNKEWVQKYLFIIL